ncbi:MerR family transcriptional regulator [Streptomyces sp. XY006]|uniref:MerR family transcriptional regulator n=1 Tax=Streptomyces sp. XY006 TaxID=2021410 RepID=UPI000B8BF688|nr:MerR family transcriptional regulator [Streptomyces sp. XY006]OXS30446.1 transcriptional regulator [Streptomyces sp. XY006]
MGGAGGGGGAVGGGAAGAGLTTGEVARRLGVAPTTVRTWDRRYGLGPDAHTGGRHRRWTAGDLARLERMCALTATGIPPAEAARMVREEAPPDGGSAPAGGRVGGSSPAGSSDRVSPEADESGGSAGAGPEAYPARDAAEAESEADPAGRLTGIAPGPEPAGPGGDAAPRRSTVASTSGSGSPSAVTRARARSRAGSGLRLGDVRQECKGIARAALRLDAAALDELLQSAIDEHGLVTAWTEVIMPTLQAVGRKWESSGEKYVEVEHFLSWHVSGALRRSTPVSAADRPGALTVLACVPGENHTLPLEVLAAALAERGLPVRMFGGALPVESLVTAVRRTGPVAVALWAQSRGTASRPLAQHVAAMEWGVRGARRKPVVLTIGPGWAGGRAVPGLPRPTGLAEAVAVVESVVSR